MDDCIFCKIANKAIPKEFIYQDEDVMVFPDIHPVRTIHLLIVPKKHFSELTTVDSPIVLEKLFIIVQSMIREQQLHDKGYRVVINGGGAQIVPHLHIHLMGPMKKTDVM